MWPFCMRRHLMTQLLIVSSYLMKVSHLHWFQFSPRPFDLSTELASWGLVVSHLPRHQSSSTFHQTPWKIVYETKRKNPRTSGGHVFWNLGIFSKKKKEKDRTTSTSSLRVISLLLSTSGDDVSGGVFLSATSRRWKHTEASVVGHIVRTRSHVGRQLDLRLFPCRENNRTTESSDQD